MINGLIIHYFCNTANSTKTKLRTDIHRSTYTEQEHK